MLLASFTSTVDLTGINMFECSKRTSFQVKNISNVAEEPAIREYSLVVAFVSRAL